MTEDQSSFSIFLLIYLSLKEEKNNALRVYQVKC